MKKNMRSSSRCGRTTAPVEARSFRDVQQRLLDQFGGVTYFPQPNEELWRMGNVTYRDEIVIYRVVSDKKNRRRRFPSPR